MKINVRNVLIAVVAMIFCLPTLSIGQTITKLAPFESSQDCNFASQFGDASVSASNQPQSGGLTLKVRATKIGSATGRSGAGFTYIPNFTGNAMIEVQVRVAQPSFDYLSVLRFRVPYLGITLQPGIASIDSRAFLRATNAKAGSVVNMTQFKGDNLTPLSSGNYTNVPVVGGYIPIVYRVDQYYTPLVRTVQISTSVENGQPVRICSGVQSSVTTASPFTLVSISEASYVARVLQVTIRRQ
jgi:hypothetical protein